MKTIISLATLLMIFLFVSADSSFNTLTSNSVILQEEEEELMQEEEEEMMEEEEEMMEEEEDEPESVKEEEAFQEMEVEEDMMDVPDEIPEIMKYYREKYDETYDFLFEEVWDAVKKSIESTNCMIIKEKYAQNDEGLFKGSIKSDFCVHATGEDTTLKVLKRYSLKMPIIRGGIWVSARMQYKFVIREQEDGTVYLLLKSEVSGREDHVTEEVHFWDSNGYLETIMLERIKKLLEG